ncbi:MAG: nitronate monooxygenase [Chloroflexota bacterium]
MHFADESLRIIQGGMGVAVSGWRLARTVAELGQMGVVSGTALDTVMVRRLQLGDPGGHVRRALASFPQPSLAQHIVDAYYIPGGKAMDAPFKVAPMPTLGMGPARMALMVLANYVEIFLAKDGHAGPIGINYLEKLQLPTLPSLLGAMLAGVDYVVMGGGIPLAIPGLLDRLARWEPVEMAISVEGNSAERSTLHRLDPTDFCGADRPALQRPKFLAIVSSDVVAKGMLRRASGRVDGFVVEDYTAGGHNAPPRRDPRAAPGAGPAFGPRDVPDLAAIKALGLPFWLGGSRASPQHLAEALAAGATGLQVGSAFAYCEESDILPEIRYQVLRRQLQQSVQVVTDFRASPTGYPFKIVPSEAVAPVAGAGRERARHCDLGYLRTPYVGADGRLSYRCPAEPVEAYLRKGGALEDTVGRQCLCNGLSATIGLAQVRADGPEPPIVTSGQDLSFVPHLAAVGRLRYSARDVVAYILGASE